MTATIFSEDEIEKQVIDLYFNKRKKTRDVAKIMRISFTKIGNILKKERERQQREMERENGNGNGNGKAEQQQYHQIIPTTSSSAIIPSLPSLSLSAAELEELTDKQKAAIAYKLYDQGRTPVQVVTTLFLNAREAMMYYRYFWKLKRQHQLYEIYPEIEQSLPSPSITNSAYLLVFCLYYAVDDLL